MPRAPRFPLPLSSRPAVELAHLCLLDPESSKTQREACGVVTPALSSQPGPRFWHWDPRLTWVRFPLGLTQRQKAASRGRAGTDWQAQTRGPRLGLRGRPHPCSFSPDSPGSTPRSLGRGPETRPYPAPAPAPGFVRPSRSPGPLGARGCCAGARSALLAGEAGSPSAPLGQRGTANALRVWLRSWALRTGQVAR